MFKLSEIKELIKLVDQSSIQELEIQEEGSKLIIRKPNKTESVFVTSPPTQPTYFPAPQNQTFGHINETAAPQTTEHPVANIVVEQANLHRIISPMVGTFYQASSPEAANFVKVGDKVKEKTVVCIVEAMKLMNDIVADTNGTIVEILVENGQLVEYGQPLFLVKSE